MYVESFERYSDVANFDLENGVQEILDRSVVVISPADISGVYSEVEGQHLIFFRDKAGELRIWYGGQSTKIDKAEVLWRPLGDGLVSFEATYGERRLSLSYRPEYPTCDDPTPFIEDEQFDVGLFIWNVVNDARRREEIFRPNRR